MRPRRLAGARRSAAPPRGWRKTISVMAGLRPGHPRLSCIDSARTWMPGTKAGHDEPDDGWWRVSNSFTKKKAAWFPRRPFLSYGGSTLTGDFRTSAPGAYLPAVSYSVAAANRGSRELWPRPTRWFPILAN